jgi:hypothetical protein
MNLVFILSLYFAVKVAVLGGVSLRIQRFTGSWTMAVALGWVAVHLYLIGVLLLLSPLRAANGSAVWLALGAGSLFTAREYTVDRLAITKSGAPFLITAVTSVGLSVFVFLTYRSLYFFDTTWDALTYELPRISFYAQFQSLFVHQPSVALNIFANEWNGELVALLARLATGSDQAIGFGGAEIWLWGCIALDAVGRRLGVSIVGAALIALLLMTTPAALGLAMVVKGDLLAAIALCLGLGCLFPKEEPPAGFLLASGLVVLSFGAGAKVALLPIAFLLVVHGCIRLARDPLTRRWLLLVAALCALGTARYVTNIFVYHNPVKRVGAEHAVPGFATLRENVGGVACKWFDTISWPWAAPSERWVLGFGFGAAGWLALLSIALVVLSKRGRIERFGFAKWWLVGIFAVSWLYVGLNIHWQSWAFRYHLPWVMTVALFALAVGFRRLTARGSSRCALVLLAVTVIQAIYPCGHGEVIFGSFAEARARSQLERKVAFNGYMWSPALQTFVSGPPSRVVIFNQLDSAILPFFGDDSRHRVTLVASAEALTDQRVNQSDAVVLAGPKLENYDLISSSLEAAGMRVSAQNVFFTLWSRPGRAALAPCFPGNPPLTGSSSSPSQPPLPHFTLGNFP